MKRIVYVIITIALIGTMLISAINIFKNTQEDIKQDQVYSELQNMLEDDQNDSQEITNIQNNIEINENEITTGYDKLFNLNTDMIAWLKIEGTNINYPVMQTKNKPDYYLNKNFYKEQSTWGTPYMEEECDINTSSNLIIYGHHINNNNMFGELEKYKSKDYYNNHKIITLITKNETRKYEIITVFMSTVYENHDFKYYEFINYKTKQDLDDFIEECKRKAFYDTEVEYAKGDKFITLSTCEYSNKNGRLVVVGKEI